MYSYGPPHMAEKEQDDQLEHTYSSSVRIQDVALKICQKRWMIGKSGERGLGISVLAAWHNDDDMALRRDSIKRDSVFFFLRFPFILEWFEKLVIWSHCQKKTTDIPGDKDHLCLFLRCNILFRISFKRKIWCGFALSMKENRHPFIWKALPHPLVGLGRFHRSAKLIDFSFQIRVPLY